MSRRDFQGEIFIVGTSCGGREKQSALKPFLEKVFLKKNFPGTPNHFLPQMKTLYGLEDPSHVKKRPPKTSVVGRNASSTNDTPSSETESSTSVPLEVVTGMHEPGHGNPPSSVLSPFPTSVSPKSLLLLHVQRL